MQNIPIKTKRGRQIRKAFISRDKNHEIIAADYSQIELRIIASLSEDRSLISAFNNGQDIHQSTASRVFNISLDKVSREQRANAKTINFGIIYGVSAFGLSQQTNLNRSESKELIDTYYMVVEKLESDIRSHAQLGGNPVQFIESINRMKTLMSLGWMRSMLIKAATNARERGYKRIDIEQIVHLDPY